MFSAVRAGRAAASGSVCLTPALVTLVLTIPGIIATVQVSTRPVLEAEIKKAISIPCVPTISTPNTTKYVQWFVMEKNARQRIYFQDMENSTVDAGTDYTHRIKVDKMYTLTIDPVVRRDERTFHCQVGAGPVGSGEAETLLKVYAAPDMPVIEKDSRTISLIETEAKEIARCVTRNGYPAPNVTWFKDRTPLHADPQMRNRISVKLQATEEANGLYTMKSTLSYLPVKRDKDATFYCEVSYRMPVGIDMMKESAKINISISYPPENAEFLIHPKVLKEMDNMTMECQSDGTSSVDYTFFKILDGEMVVIKSDGNKVVVTALSRNDSGLYGCNVLDLETDNVLVSNKTIIVNYLDPIVLTPKGPYVFTEGKKNVRISCEAEASQRLTVAWTKRKKTVVSTGKWLKLSMVALEDAGNYSCKVAIPGVPSLSRQKTISIVVEGPPHVNCTTEKFQKNGPYVNLTCVFRGYPIPVVTCNAHKAPTLMYHHQKNYVVSELILPLPTGELQLTCNGTNQHGDDDYLFIVQGDVAQAKSSGGVVIVVIIVCILLLAILGAILYFLYKKGKIPCGRSGKQSITQAEGHDNIVVEVKNDQKVPEETVLLQGVNGDKKPPNHQ
ncbi:cell surface glycoprotein MUC18 [Amblyraja radiata]|uniref:cell surface glycoprotein MUC18 n=1 Tax=Amblyraja radiata TaxID=386614 RepID=UPI0014037C5D|nr:cell surface glycoprotein MUC18 [Amblyraja radiata]